MPLARCPITLINLDESAIYAKVSGQIRPNKVSLGVYGRPMSMSIHMVVVAVSRDRDIVYGLRFEINHWLDRLY